jgi:hypothetical protein
MVIQSNSRPVRLYAVKLDGEGWVGVSADLGRCHGHEHETPELARLCALHRLQEGSGAGDGVLLLPVRRSSTGGAARASGDA